MSKRLTKTQARVLDYFRRYSEAEILYSRYITGGHYIRIVWRDHMLREIQPRTFEGIRDRLVEISNKKEPMPSTQVFRLKPTND